MRRFFSIFKIGDSFIRKFLVKYLRQESIGIFSFLFYSLLVILTPYCTRYLIDSMERKENNADFFKIISIFFFIYIFQPIFFYIGSRILTYISEHITYKIRSKMFERIVRTSHTFFNTATCGEILSRLIGDSEKLGLFLSELMPNIIKDILFIIFITLSMLSLSFNISVWILGLLLFYMILNIVISIKIKPISFSTLKANDNLYRLANQGIKNIEFIKTLVIEQEIIDQFDAQSLDVCDKNRKLVNFKLALKSTNNTLVVFMNTILYCLGFYLHTKEKITLGTIFALDVYLQMIVPPIENIIEVVNRYWEVMPVVKRAGEYFDLPLEPQKSYLSNKNTSCIRFENVSFRYPGQTIDIFKNFNFEINGNGLYCFIGESGIGKSTIAKLILNLYEPNTGKITIQLNKKENKNIRNYISYVPQHAKLFNNTIMYNLSIGGKDILLSDVVFICKQLNLHNRIMSFENGYHEVVTEKANLSGGEMQRILFARAYLQHKPIVVLDEVTSSLDKITSSCVAKVINSMVENSIVILTTHNLSLLKHAKNVFYLDENGIHMQSC